MHTVPRRSAARALRAPLRAALAPLALLGAPAAASVTFFTDHLSFTQFNLGQGKVMKGMEDFEYSTVQPGAKVPFPNPLQAGVPRPEFPAGLLSPNLIIQTNITPGPNPPTPNPSSSQTALWVNGAGFIGSNSVKIGTDEFLTNTFSSLDLIFTTGDKTGIALDVSTFAGFNQGHGGFVIGVYDLSGALAGSFTIAGATPVEPSKNFIGMWSSAPIGRVNVWGIFAVPQPFAIDNIEMWVVPAPGTASLLALGAAAAVRRRRR